MHKHGRLIQGSQEDKDLVFAAGVRAIFQEMSSKSFLLWTQVAVKQMQLFQCTACAAHDTV